MSDKIHNDFDHIGQDRPHKKHHKKPTQNLSLNDVKQLIEAFDQHPSIGELTWKDFSIKRPTAPNPIANAIATPAAIPAPAATQAPAAASAETESKPAAPMNAIKSPMVGTCYLAPSPDAGNFVEIGQKISVGDTLCLIEAMKMFNKIKADKTGTIKRRLVEDGQAVEFDQPLFEIDDSGA